MQIHEQIYTSAEKLLDPAQSDLGVVAQSKDLPRKIANQLGELASYRLLESLPADQTHLHPPRIVAELRGQSNEFFAVSRIVYAGADHSGRTTPLAHHVLIPTAGFENPTASFGQAVRSLKNRFLDKWDQEPALFDPPRELDIPSLPPRFDRLGVVSEATWASVVGFLAGRLNQDTSGAASTVVFVLSPNDHEAGLDLLSILADASQSPGSRHLNFQSHIVKTTDIVGRPTADCFHVTATYSGTEYLTEISGRPEKRRPTIIDLTDASLPPLQNVGFARWVEQQLIQKSDPATLAQGFAIRAMIGDVDESKQPGVFEQTIRIYRNLSSIRWMDHVTELGQQVGSLGRISPSLAKLAGSWSSSAIQKHFKAHKAQYNWNGLLDIACDENWPAEARKLCLSAIEKAPAHSVPVYFANDTARTQPVLTLTINRIIEAKPKLAEQLLQGDPSVANASRRHLERRMVSNEVSPEVRTMLAEALIRTGEVSQQHQAARSLLVASPNLDTNLRPQLDWLTKVSGQPDFAKSLVRDGDLPQDLTQKIRLILEPPATASPKTPTPQADVTQSPRTQATINTASPPQIMASGNFAASSPLAGTRSHQRRARHITDPSKMIRSGGIADLVAIVVGTVVIVLGRYGKTPRLETDWSILAIAIGCFFLVIAAVTYFLFHKGMSSVKSQRMLGWFGIISAVMLVVSVVLILVSFLHPFIPGVGS